MPCPDRRARDLRRPCDGRLLVYARADDDGRARRTTTATGSPPTPSALKTIDPAAFQAVVDAAAKKLLVPGALVLLRTPQGTFTPRSAPRSWARRHRRTPTRISGSPRTPRP